MLRYLLEKEFKQLFRHKFIPKMMFGMPIVMMLILPWALTMEIKNVRLAVVDHEHTPMTHALQTKLNGSSYFLITKESPSYHEAISAIERNEADIILEFGRDFDKTITNTGMGKLMISINAVNGMKGGVSMSYLLKQLNQFTQELNHEQFSGTHAGIEVHELYRYNRTLDYKSFMIPALMVMLLSLLCGFLPALNIVSEKEVGTIEQINVTPIKRWLFILSKLIPYWVMAFIVLTLCFIIAYLVYGLIPVSGYGPIYLGVALFGLTISGSGLVISNYSETMQQALFVIFFFMLIFVLLSGLFTPIESMPAWAQTLTKFNPLRYFISIMRMGYLKGSSILEMLPNYMALASFGLFFYSWAILSYKKRS